MVRSGLPEGGGTLGIVNGSGQLIGVGPAHGARWLAWFPLSCGVFIRWASPIDRLAGAIGGSPWFSPCRTSRRLERTGSSGTAWDLLDLSGPIDQVSGAKGQPRNSVGRP